MLPVLEDNVVALRAAEGQLSITDLLSYSAVCGVGLDTVPLPGEIDETVLAGIFARCRCAGGAAQQTAYSTFDADAGISCR